MRVRFCFAGLAIASLLLSGCEKKEAEEAHEFSAQDEAVIRAINDSAL